MNRDRDFALTARQLVDQHYACGPDALKQVVADTLASASKTAAPEGSPRERLRRELDELERTSERGSE